MYNNVCIYSCVYTAVSLFISKLFIDHICISHKHFLDYITNVLLKMHAFYHSQFLTEYITNVLLDACILSFTVDETRVVLTPDTESNNDYINANFIKVSIFANIDTL